MIDLDREFERACSAYDGTNFETLSEVDRILVAIWALEAEVNNGGFDQLFFNSTGELAFYAPTALNAIGANEMARIVAAANAKFGEAGPPRGRDERQSRLFAITNDKDDTFAELDDCFYAYPDDIAALLTAYLEAALQRRPNKRLRTDGRNGRPRAGETAYVFFDPELSEDRNVATLPIGGRNTLGSRVRHVLDVTS